MSNYVFKLYIAGKTPHSQTAVTNLQHICQEYLGTAYELTVIDVLQHPQLAEEAKILATPTLVKESPAPIRWIIGDLSEKTAVLAALGLPFRTISERQNV